MLAGSGPKARPVTFCHQIINSFKLLLVVTCQVGSKLSEINELKAIRDATAISLPKQSFGPNNINSVTHFLEK